MTIPNNSQSCVNSRFHTQATGAEIEMSRTLSVCVAIWESTCYMLLHIMNLNERVKKCDKERHQKAYKTQTDITKFSYHKPL